MSTIEQNRLRASLLRESRSYARSDTPWLLETYGKKLFRYLSGGGMGALGRSIRQEEADAKARRFLTAASVLGVVWLVLLLA